MKRTSPETIKAVVQLLIMIIIIMTNAAVVDCKFFTCHNQSSVKVLALAGSFDITGKKLRGIGALTAAHMALQHIYYNSTLLQGYCLNMTWGDTKVSIQPINPILKLF